MLGLLLGYLRPTTGEITIGGMAPRQWVETRGVAYLPELMTLPLDWTVEGALQRLGTLAGLQGASLREAVERVIATVEIGEHQKKRLKALSKGNLQRVGLAQSLLTDPEVVVFDEPTHGLDPVWTQRFRDIVTAARRPDRTIIIASHNLDELERLADRVIIIDRGRIQREVRVRDQAGAEEHRRWRIRFIGSADPLIAHLPSATRLADGDLACEGTLEALNAGLAAALEGGARIDAVLPAESMLEQAFRGAVDR